MPHFTGGTLSGRVTVDGRDTARFRPRELADVVGVVGQDPLAGFVTDTVEEELAYTMEQLAIDPAVMRTRVEETLDLLGLAELRHRALHALSGGQQQRVAIGAVLTAHPRVLVLDEPTSALDPTSAEDVLAAITRLVHDLGRDRGAGRAPAGAGAAVRRPGHLPARRRHGRRWRPCRRAGPLPARRRPWSSSAGWPAGNRCRCRCATPAAGRPRCAPGCPARRRPPTARPAPARPGPPALAARGIVVRYGALVAVRGVGLTLRPGEITALMGRNGSGKSSLLWALQGAGRRAAGTVRAGDGQADPAALAPAAARRLVGLVPQTPADLLYLDTVAAELAQADQDARPASTARAAVVRPRPAREILDGSRRASRRARTRGTCPTASGSPWCWPSSSPRRRGDPARRADSGAGLPGQGGLTAALDRLAGRGHAIVVATHDVEFAAAAATGSW